MESNHGTTTPCPTSSTFWINLFPCGTLLHDTAILPNALWNHAPCPLHKMQAQQMDGSGKAPPPPALLAKKNNPASMLNSTRMESIGNWSTRNTQLALEAVLTLPFSSTYLSAWLVNVHTSQCKQREWGADEISRAWLQTGQWVTSQAVPGSPGSANCCSPAACHSA